MADTAQNEQKPKASESKSENITRRTAAADKSEPVADNKSVIEQWIYIGPTIKQLGLETNSVFTQSIPKHIAKKMDEQPELRFMFIAVNDLAQKNSELAAVGSELHTVYEALEAKKGAI